MSKLVERAVFDQVHAHLSEHDLYPLLQTAYRRGHSTETALLKIYNDMLMAMNRQDVVLLVLLDLSAAFDTHGTKNWIYCTFDSSQKLSQIWYWL